MKERFNIAGDSEGLGWGLLVKEAEIRAGYGMSIENYSNGDDSKMKN